MKGAIVTPAGHPAWLEAIRNNWYEASRWSPHRSFIWFPVQDARKDLDRYTRYELIRKSRYLYKNSPFIRGVTERLVTLTIGTGIHPVPVSGEPKFDKLAKVVWRVICRQPCVDSRMHHSTYQRIKARGRFLDGEGYTLKVADAGLRDKIQGIDADRVTSDTSETVSDSRSTDPNVDDGILLDRFGMPIGYRVRGVPTPYPASAVVHHVTFTRDNQKHGEPIYAAGINAAHDVDDILAYEKQAVKDASSRKDIIQTASGELDPEAMRAARFNSGGLPTIYSLPDDDNTRTDWYKVNFGAETQVLRAGDKYTPYIPQRPGQAWQGFMDWLCQAIVLGTGGLPPSLVLPVEIGGTDIRRDMELGQRVIEPWQMDIAAEWQDIWEFFIGGAIDDGVFPVVPPNWNEVRWHFPKSITVDRGRDAHQDRADVRAGLMSHEEYHGRYSEHAEEVDEAIEMEVRKRRFRLLGTPIEEPFESVADFVGILSLDPKLFTAATVSAEESESDDIGTGYEPGESKSSGGGD